MERSDRDLLNGYRAGDLASLDALIDRHRRVLFGYVLSLIGRHEDADDVFQEVWLRVIRKQESYEDQNFVGWLVRIAHNVIVDRARRRKPDMSLDQEDGSGRSLQQTLVATGAGPAHGLEARDLGARIAAASATLPEEQREVFLMRTQADLAFKDIARIQGVSINTALARMQYALAKLRPLLQADYNELAET